jgi:hypothetical protein
VEELAVFGVTELLAAICAVDVSIRKGMNLS